MSHQFQQITPTDKFGWHLAYLDVYEKIFAPFKDENIQLLEIGTDGGGGLRMYADYFPIGNIVGVDISPVPEGIKNCENIRHFQLDAYTKKTVALLKADYESFDFIIDDGPHTLGSQMFFVQNYSHLLSDQDVKAVAIVEDIQDPAHIAQLQSVLPPGFHSMAIDLRHVEPTRYDNLLFCVFR